MLTGSDYIRDERRRLARIVSQAELWTERRLYGGTIDGQANAMDERATLQELKTGDIRERGAYDWHRRFQVRIEHVRPKFPDSPSWNSQEMEATYSLRVGYLAGGGDSFSGTPTQIDEVAVQDLEAVRQQVMHHATRSAATGSGVTGGRTQKIDVTGYRKIIDESDRQVWEMPIVAWLIVDAEAAQTFTGTEALA